MATQSPVAIAQQAASQKSLTKTELGSISTYLVRSLSKLKSLSDKVSKAGPQGLTIGDQVITKATVKALFAEYASQLRVAMSLQKTKRHNNQLNMVILQDQMYELLKGAELGPLSLQKDKKGRWKEHGRLSEDPRLRRMLEARVIDRNLLTSLFYKYVLHNADSRQGTYFQPNSHMKRVLENTRMLVGGKDMSKQIEDRASSDHYDRLTERSQTEKKSIFTILHESVDEEGNNSGYYDPKTDSYAYTSVMTLLGYYHLPTEMMSSSDYEKITDDSFLEDIRSLKADVKAFKRATDEQKKEEARARRESKRSTKSH